MPQKIRTPKEIVLTAKPNAEFAKTVRELSKALTFKKGPNVPVACAPCNSGIDRIVIENPAYRGIR